MADEEQAALNAAVREGDSWDTQAINVTDKILASVDDLPDKVRNRLLEPSKLWAGSIGDAHRSWPYAVDLIWHWADAIRDQRGTEKHTYQELVDGFPGMIDLFESDPDAFNSRAKVVIDAAYAELYPSINGPWGGAKR